MGLGIWSQKRHFHKNWELDLGLSLNNQIITIGAGIMTTSNKYWSDFKSSSNYYDSWEESGEYIITYGKKILLKIHSFSQI